MEHADHHVPTVERLAVGQRREREGHIRGLVQAIVGARPGGELAAAGSMVRLDVGIDDPRDACALEGGKFDVAVEVVGVGVYDRRRLVSHSPEHVGRTPGFGVEDGWKIIVALHAIARAAWLPNLWRHSHRSLARDRAISMPTRPVCLDRKTRRTYGWWFALVYGTLVLVKADSLIIGRGEE
jgi:hypothetical protein